MRQVRYSVAISLDGYIARNNGDKACCLCGEVICCCAIFNGIPPAFLKLTLVGTANFDGAELLFRHVGAGLECVEYEETGINILGPNANCPQTELTANIQMNCGRTPNNARGFRLQWSLGAAGALPMPNSVAALPSSRCNPLRIVFPTLSVVDDTTIPGEFECLGAFQPILTLP